MPRSGWCRECGEWVWVNDEGACQNGHGSECVDGIHDAQPQDDAPQSRAQVRPGDGFGAGDFPLMLDRFNWAAFFLPLFWAFAYGAWPIVSWWLITLALPLTLAAVFGVDASAGSVRTIIGISAVSEVASGAVRLWAGSSGNRLVWAREQLRLKLVEGSAPRFSVEKFVTRQRIWVRVGATLIVVAAIATAVINSTAWAEYGMGAAGAAEPFVWLGGEVLLAIWLASTMTRDGNDATEGSAEED